MLAAARRLVAGDTAVDGGPWARSAVFLARQALEKGTRRVLIRKYAVTNRASFRSQLIALHVVADDPLAEDVAYVWAALSEVSHHRGYTMPPTAGELKRWMAVVERVLAMGRV